MNDKIYPTADVAFRRFAQRARNKGFPIMQVLPKHNFRHRLITSPKLDFYCLFRRDDSGHGSFEKFNDYFPIFVQEHPHYKGHAESINEEVIGKICNNPIYDMNSPEYRKDVILVYIYKDTRTYMCYPQQFKKFAEKYNLIRTHKAPDIRKKVGGGERIINEVTYHMPFKEDFFKNFDQWFEKQGHKIIYATPKERVEHKETQLTFKR